MTDPKIRAFPRAATDKMPYPPVPDLGPDAEAAVQSAQSFAPANEDSDQRRSQPNPDVKASRWHTPLLLIAAALVGAVFLFAIR